MARLFITPREINFINDLSKEVIKDVIGQKIYYYQISNIKSNVHDVYQESPEKIFDNPIEIDEELIIIPDWDERVYNHKHIIKIKPGMAFGTGHHPTTQLSILLLEEVVKGGEIIADIGAGSGILAIVAAKLGAKKICAVDVDKKAVEIARENFGHNAVEDLVDVKQMDRVTELNQKFHLIVANILTKVILPMIPQVPKYLKSGGHLILSGIMENEVYKVKTELIKNNFECLKTRQSNEWFAILARLKK